jgi:hypothetical protein
MSSDG